MMTETESKANGNSNAPAPAMTQHTPLPTQQPNATQVGPPPNLFGVLFPVAPLQLAAPQIPNNPAIPVGLALNPVQVDASAFYAALPPAQPPTTQAPQQSAVPVLQTQQPVVVQQPIPPVPQQPVALQLPIMNHNPAAAPLPGGIGAVNPVQVDPSTIFNLYPRAPGF